jgi:hypothetical protein
MGASSIVHVHVSTNFKFYRSKGLHLVVYSDWQRVSLSISHKILCIVCLF